MCINKRTFDILPGKDVPGDGMEDDALSSACLPDFDHSNIYTCTIV